MHVDPAGHASAAAPWDLGAWLGGAVQAPQTLCGAAVHGATEAVGSAVAPCLPLPMRQRGARLAPVASREAWTRANLPQAVADNHPDYVEAMVLSRLHRHLAQRGESGVLEGQPGLRVDGVWTPWQALRQRFVFAREGVSLAGAPLRRCAYLKDGLTEWDSALWGPQGRPLPAQRCLPEAERPATPELQVLMADGDEHAWCRLIDTNGDVFTFGAAIDADAYKNYGPLLNTVVARIMAPDRCEAMDREADMRRIALTPETFADVRAFVEACAHGGLSFNWLNRNCNTFTAMVIERATGERPSALTSPQEYVMRHSALAPLFPPPLRGVLDGLITASTLGFNPFIQGMTCLWGSTQASNPYGHCYLEHPLQLLTPLLFSDPEKLRDWVRGGGALSQREPP